MVLAGVGGGHGGAGLSRHCVTRLWRERLAQEGRLGEDGGCVSTALRLSRDRGRE